MGRKRIKVAVLVLYAIAYCLACLPASAQTYIDNERVWSNNDVTKNIRTSDHFRLVWGNGQNPATSWEYGSVTEELAQGNLQAFEHAWHVLHDAPPAGRGIHIPYQSINPLYQDGNYYRTNFEMFNTGIDAGGGTGSVDSYGFPWLGVNPQGLRYDPGPDASLHEYIHTILINAGGFNNTPYDGYWHESTDGWIGIQSYWYAVMDGYSVFHNLSLPHGRSQYDSWLLPEYLYENPTYGISFMNTLWEQAHGSSGEYMFDAMVRLHPAGELDPYNAIKDCLGRMAARNVTWDYLGKQYYRYTTPYVIDGTAFNFRIRRGTTELTLQPDSTTWYRVPQEHAPCQGGYNICPIELVGKNGAGNYSVGINFQPLWDSVRKSDWRACLVAVNSAGDARYSNIWNSGINSITLSADENTLYLVVAATPDFMAFNPMPGPKMTDAATAPQGYRVSFVNTSARPYLIRRDPPNVAGHYHSNGGGFVSNTATVDATAYVGPNAIVYDRAKVLGNARIEDYAQVLTDAQVRDYAVVSGHAVIKDSAQIYGYAKVRDWATVDGFAQIYENARVIEHAYVGQHVKYLGNAIIKGCAQDYDLDASNIPSVSGCAIKDGDCTNYASMTKGVLVGCVYGADTTVINALADNNYMYCGYDFDKTSPNYALDEYGLTYGYLMGGPSVVDGSGTNRGSVLSLDGSDDYVELRYGVSDFKDYSVAAWVKWTGSANDQKIFSFGNGSNKCMYLTPKDATTGNLRFAITNGTSTQYLDGTAPLAANTWTHVAVTLSGDTGVLYVNGTAVDTDTAISINPEDLNGANVSGASNWNFIGRGNSGGYLAAQIDDFRVYYKALNTTEITALQTATGGTVTVTSDTTAPTPNAATWLVAPTAMGTNAVVMSATKGSDASNYVQYYFTCTSGGGHDSGWISTNRYYDSGLTPGATCTYTVKMRDKAGNETAASSTSSVTLPGDTSAPTPSTATFLLAPKGISSTAIKMVATPGTDASPLVEYQFNRTSPTTASSGWQASNVWTDTGLTSGTTYSYTVQMRDAYGNVGTVSSVSTAVARDDTAPTRYTYGEWSTLPYATIDNCVSMRARSVTGGEILACNIAGETVQYYFHCYSGGGPDSGWISTNVWKSSALTDGTYGYQFKIRDALGNETPYSSVETATVSPTTGYHSYNFGQLNTLPDAYLASFNAVVVQSNYDNYIVKDTSSNTTIKVMPAIFGPTDSSKVFKTVKVDGYLRTISGTRLVTFATVTATGDATTYAVSGKVTGTGGAGVSGATVYFSATASAKTNPTRTVATDANGNYNVQLPNGIWYVAAEATGYYLSSDMMITVNGSALTNVNIALTPAYTITASAGTGGSISPSGSTLVASGSSQAFTITPSGGYSIGNVLVDGTNVGSVTSYTFNNVTANHTISVTFNANTRSIPRTSDLLFSCVTDTFPESGNTGAWASYLPSGQSFAVKNTPSVEQIGGVKWEKNINTEKDGYDVGTFSSAVPVNGVSAVVAVKPTRVGTDSNWQSVVDIFYDRFVLGVMNGSGKVCVRRNSTTTTKSTLTIPNGQTTILSAVVQPDGKYKVWANGTLFLDVTTTSSMTSLVPNVPGPYANHMNIGRNNPDDWSTYNGNIGDVFVYKVALTDAERQQLENDLSSKFNSASTHTITASAGTGGTISPEGILTIAHGGSANFVITPDTGFAIADVTVDGVSQGAISSYAFTDLAANHTISATFTNITYTITASAGTGGSISPSGVSTVAYGSNTTYTITPSQGYAIASVLVDGASVGAVSSYSFDNVTANHTISVTFSILNYTIDASAGTGGSISPSGTLNLPYGSDTTFTITPATGYSISEVIVDGVDQGTLSSYTFSALSANHTISASFTPITYTITASAGANGSISPSGAVSVNYGANQTFYITPSANYKITSVLVDGSSVGALGVYTFSNVTASHTISATFEPELPTALVALDVASLPTGTLSTWTNTGSYGGSFDRNTSTPTVGTVGGKKCITFDGNDRMVSNFSAPTGITGVCDYTIAYWVYNPKFTTDECVLCWSRRSGADGTAAAFNFGSGSGNGAVVHTGTSDMGFAGQPSTSAWHHICITYDGTTEKVYVDGSLNNSETKSLAIYSGYLLYIGCGYTHDGTTYSPTRYFSGSLGTVRIFDEALTAGQVTMLYNQTW